VSNPMAAIAGSVSMSNDSQRAVDARTGTAANHDRANSARLSARRRAITTALATAAKPLQSKPCTCNQLSGGAAVASAQNKMMSTLKLNSTAPEYLRRARERRLSRINLAAARRGALT
jgi:hypothetical protein